MNQCKRKKRGIAHFVSSFGCSIEGLRTALSETAIRQELYLGIAHALAMVLVPLSLDMKIVLSVLWVAIIITELLNTAIETVVDLVCSDYHELAKRAKDLGSAAVFCGLVAYITSWGALLVKVLWRG